MTTEKYEKIVDGLARKTANDELEWKETADPNTFQVSFVNYSITIEERYVPEQNLPDYLVTIRNSEGNAIDSFSDTFLDQRSMGYYKVMRDIYQKARRQALGVDSALDEILNELEGNT